MPELMRFRLLRAPQKSIPGPTDLIPVETAPLGSTAPQALRFRDVIGRSADLSALLANPDPLGAPAQAYLAKLASPGTFGTILPPPDVVLTAIYKLEEWLTSQGNRPDVGQLQTEITNTVGPYLRTTAWHDEEVLLGEYLVVATIVPNPPQLREVLTRLLLVTALVDLITATPAAISTPDDVFAALHWRTLVFADDVVKILLRLATREGSILVRRPGFADLYLTVQEWNRYEAAEIESIESVLPGENKSHSHTVLDQTAVTTTVEQQTTTTTQLEVTTTDRTGLQQNSTSDTAIAAHVDAKVDTSGSYGPTHVDTHLGGSLDYSQHDATQKAVTQSHETVTRSLTSVQNMVLQIRTTETLKRVTDHNRHSIDNTGQATPVVGIYRWVDRIDRVQVMRYPNRYLLEFELPEPAARLRWLHASDKTQGLLHQPPMPFTKDGKPVDPLLNPLLVASDITDRNYLELATRYAAPGMSPPPGPETVATSIKKDSLEDPATDKEPIKFNSDATATVPVGYQAISWQASILAWHNGRVNPLVIPPKGSIWLTVADGKFHTLFGGEQFEGVVTDTFDVTTPGFIPIMGAIPIEIRADSLYGYTIAVEVACEPTALTLTKWRNNSYDQLLAAYLALEQQNYDELTARSMQQPSLIDSYSPTRAKQIVLEEIKRQTVEMLTGSRFQGRPAITWDPNKTDPPQTNLAQAAQSAPEIQFLEQAFEWENLTFVLYPYYWGDSSRWGDMMRLDGNEEDFAAFLRAGSVRVVLPARPGLEDQVNFYAAFRVIWGGGPVPAPGDSDYLSVADEIKAQQQRPRDGVPVDAWEVRVPTTLVWLENDAGLPTNPNATINLPGSFNMTPQNGSSVSGTGQIMKGSGSFTVTIKLTGMTPNSSHISHVHTGDCAKPGGVAYALQQVVADSTGAASVTSTVAVDYSVPPGGWYVDVHHGSDLNSPANKPSISCGDLPVV